MRDQRKIVSQRDSADHHVHGIHDLSGGQQLRSDLTEPSSTIGVEVDDVESASKSSSISLSSDPG